MALETVASEPDTSLAAHILTETPPVETPDPDPSPPETPPAVDPAVVAAAEADSAAPDASVSAAARALRANRADVRKARIQAEIDAKVREREELRAEVARLKQQTHPAAAPEPAETEAKPKLEDFEDFSAFMDARDAWTWRQAERKAEAKIQEAQQTAVLSTQRAQLVQRATETRATHADYDDVVEPVVARFDGYPGAHVVADFIASSPVGGALFYRLGKDPAALDAVLTADSPSALTRALARLEAQVTAPASPAPITTRAPAPPRHTVGGGAQSTTMDTNRDGVSLADHTRIEEAELADRRRRGLRY
jgi:hypothetical protein